MNPHMPAARWSLALFLWMILVPCPFQPGILAETRHALVIGNDSYPGNRLQNARNDARAVNETLEALGYLSTLAIDADRVTMARTIEAFSDSIQPGDLALFYYAGHGLQVAGENYLVPIDFQVSDEADAAAQGYPLSNLLEKLSLHGAKTQVIILDACRNNPFLGSRSSSNGWASRGTSIGTFLAFGTAPGSTASDDPNDNHGLFTKALLAHMGETSADIDGMFRLVREDVVRQSSGHQVPWTASSLLGSLHLNPLGDNAAPPISNLALSDSAHRNVVGRGIENIRYIDGRALASESPDTRRTSFLDVLTEAQSNLRNLNLGKAVRLLNTALELDPRSSIALRLLAVAMHLAGRDVESEEAIDRAIALDPHDARAYAYSCLILSTQDSQRSRQQCQKALDLQADLASAHLGLSFALFTVGDGPDSYSEATKAFTLDTTATETLIFRQNIPIERQADHASMPPD